MIAREKVIRDIYTSDIILMDEEIEMVYGIDDSYFEKLERIHEHIQDGLVTLTEDELDSLEKSFNEFYFEYAYAQFKRGLLLGTSLMKLN
ncbi:MAG: hypothetical protein RR630_00345 [Coprobacillus sp.]